MIVRNNAYKDRDFYLTIQEKFGIIGSSQVILENVKLLLQAAPTDLAALVTGETGTGKEVFANALHGLSKRKKYQFVSVNCAAIPDTLLESELFGYEKGAFTGANDLRKGFFETADKGTIFLDEIGELPMTTQSKLLRILETGEYSRLGSSAIRKVDARLIAATNKNLEVEVENGNFRQDLYFRLKNVVFNLPPLREHIEDIPELADYFGRKYSEKINIEYQGISQDALSLMMNMSWPGNIRELRNLIETIIGLEGSVRIKGETVRRYMSNANPPPVLRNNDSIKALVPTKNYEPAEKAELEIIFRTLLELQNNITDMKRGLHNLAIKIDDIHEKMDEISDTNFQVVKNDVPILYSDEDLNIAEHEKMLIKYALNRFDGSRKLAANALGISERTLYRKLIEMNLQ